MSFSVYMNVSSFAKRASSVSRYVNEDVCLSVRALLNIHGGVRMQAVSCVLGDRWVTSKNNVAKFNIMITLIVRRGSSRGL